MSLFFTQLFGRRSVSLGRSSTAASLKLGVSRVLLLVTLCAVHFSAVLAAPYPRDGLPIQWQQPDGTQLQLRVIGDEFYARTETVDGYTVMFDAATSAYYYAVKSLRDSSLTPSAQQAHRTAPATLTKHLKDSATTINAVRSANIQTYAPDRAARWEARRNAVSSQRERAAKLSAGVRLPELSQAAQAEQARAAAAVSGSKVGLLILVEFPDDPATPAVDPVTFPTTQAKIERMSNEVGYTDDGNTGSIRDYFSDQSGGQLIHTQLVTTVVTLPQPRNFYNFEDYPTNTVLTDNGLTGRLMVETAVNQLISDGFDFSSVTADNNTFVQATSLLFAGNTSGVWPDGLWPHAWALGTPINVGSPSSPRFVWRYQVTNVANAAPVIGTIAHELGHLLLDYPDFYDTNPSNGDSEGVGEHSLMGSGNHLNGGRTPAPIDLYLKDFSGWANITELNPGVARLESLPSTGNVGYRVSHPSNSNEYFLLENRGDGDKWAQSSPDDGILIWHVDESVSTANEQQQMTPTQHYELSVEQADGDFDLEMNNNRGDSGDLFSSTDPLFTDTTTPSANWWSGAASGFIAQVLSSPGASMDVSFYELITLSLEEALDTTAVPWVDDGSWVPVLSTTDSHDGFDVASSSAIADNEQTSLLADVVGPGVLSFWWRVSSESSYDVLRFYIDDVLVPGVPELSGEVAWQQHTVNISAGSHTLRWTYSKDGSVSAGDDAGWLDEVEYTASGIDTDGDGLSDGEELILGTDANNVDTDGDRLVDGADGVVSVLAYPAGIDSNGDGYVDGEADVGTDPTVSNSGDLAPAGNPDNVVNLGDLHIMQRMVNQFITPTALEIQLGDLNADGVLDVSDVLLLQTMIIEPVN